MNDTDDIFGNLGLDDNLSAPQAAAEAKTIDFTNLDRAFQYGRDKAAQDGKSVKWQRLHLMIERQKTPRTFVFVYAPANHHWPACIWVREGSRKLGRIQDGKFFRDRSGLCNDLTETAVLEVASDPFAAGTLFGQRTGVCCCCERKLTNEASRKAGIGPVCANRHGW